MWMPDESIDKKFKTRWEILIIEKIIYYIGYNFWSNCCNLEINKEV